MNPDRFEHLLNLVKEKTSKTKKNKKKTKFRTSTFPRKDYC